MTVPQADRTPSLSLDAISVQIRQAWTGAKAHTIEAVREYLRVGHLLGEARRRFPSNAGYGDWFREQDFGFTLQWAGRLRMLAEHEAEALALSETAVSDGGPAPGVNRLLEMLRPVEADDPEAAFLRVAERLETWGERHGMTGSSFTVPATIEEARARMDELFAAEVEHLLLVSDYGLAWCRLALADFTAASDDVSRVEAAREFSERLGAGATVALVACERFDAKYEGGLGAHLTAIWERAGERLGREDPDDVSVWAERATKAAVAAWQDVYA